jgi:hypothetical protein
MCTGIGRGLLDVCWKLLLGDERAGAHRILTGPGSEIATTGPMAGSRCERGAGSDSTSIASQYRSSTSSESEKRQRSYMIM